MNRSKIVAIITGAISIILALAYLFIVQLLDFRGEMKPAPMTSLSQQSAIVAYYSAPLLDAIQVGAQ